MVGAFEIVNRFLTMGARLTFVWEKSVESIPPEDWSACFGASDARCSRELTIAIERGNLPNVELRYLVARAGSAAIAIVPCYLQNTHLDIIAPRIVHAAAGSVRSVFPSFLRIRALIAGSPIAIARSLIGIRRSAEVDEHEVLRLLAREMEREARVLGANLLVLKELEEQRAEEVKAAMPDVFRLVPSLAAASISLGGKGATYLERLRRHYRHVYRQRKRLFEEGGVTWTRVEDFEAYADSLHQLYSQVQQKQRTVQLLPKSLFVELSRHLRGRGYVEVARKGDELLAFAIVLTCETGLLPLYVGFDYRRRDQYSLYYNALYRALEESEAQGFAEVLLGQTANESKALIGASFRPLYLALRPLSAVTSAILRLFHRTLFVPSPMPSHRVFRSDEQNVHEQLPAYRKMSSSGKSQ